VVVVDDHGLMREGLILLLKKGPSLDVVAEGATGAWSKVPGRDRDR